MDCHHSSEVPWPSIAPRRGMVSWNEGVRLIALHLHRDVSGLDLGLDLGLDTGTVAGKTPEANLIRADALRIAKCGVYSWTVAVDSRTREVSFPRCSGRNQHTFPHATGECLSPLSRKTVSTGC